MAPLVAFGEASRPLQNRAQEASPRLRPRDPLPSCGSLTSAGSGTGTRGLGTAAQGRGVSVWLTQTQRVITQSRDPDSPRPPCLPPIPAPHQPPRPAAPRSHEATVRMGEALQPSCPLPGAGVAHKMLSLKQRVCYSLLRGGLPAGGPGGTGAAFMTQVTLPAPLARRPGSLSV